MYRFLSSSINTPPPPIPAWDHPFLHTSPAQWQKHGNQEGENLLSALSSTPQGYPPGGRSLGIIPEKTKALIKEAEATFSRIPRDSVDRMLQRSFQVFESKVRICLGQGASIGWKIRGLRPLSSCFSSQKVKHFSRSKGRAAE